MKSRSFAVAGLAAAALAVLPASNAMAAGVDELVSGTPTDSLAITAGSGATFLATNFKPGSSPTSTGLLTVTSTDPSWTLSAEDNGSGAGKMAATGPSCTGSDATLTNATNLSVTNALPLASVVEEPAVGLTADPQLLATGTTLLAATAFTTNYGVTIPAGQVMLSGCIYSQNVTYTLAG